MQNIPPAPSPHTALAATILSILPATAHQIVLTIKTHNENKNGLFRPIQSETRPKRGCSDVEVRRKDVESHEAEFEDLNVDVIEVCVEDMIVPSNAATCDWTPRQH